jgi:hypothetical protein
MGVESIRDIPDDFPLNERQRRACTSVQTGKPWFSPELKEELSGLKNPLFFTAIRGDATLRPDSLSVVSSRAEEGRSGS